MNNEFLLKGRALVYLRVSTDKQAEKGLSIPAQKSRCLKYALDQGYLVDETSDIYVDEGESARTSDRPQFQILWQRCLTDKTVKAVVFYDISRLARNRIDFALVKKDLVKHGIRICSATEGIDNSPAGQMLEGMLSTVAEFFSLQSGEKVKTGMKQKIKEGGYPGRAKYGYKNVQERVSTNKVKAWIEVDWEEAKWIIRLFELFATGNYTTKSIIKPLLDEGFPVRQTKHASGMIHGNRVDRILRDRFYIGEISWGGEVNPNGKHELFLDRDLFFKVQAILDARLAGGSRQRRHFTIFKAMSYCAECGSLMCIEEHTTTAGNLKRYLRCQKSQHGQRVECAQKYAYESEYLKQISELIKQVELPSSVVEKLRNKIRSMFAEEQKVYELSRKDIQNKLEEVKKRKKNLVMNLLSDDNQNQTDLALFQSVKKDLEAEELRLTTELSKIESKIGSVIKTIEIALSLTINCRYAFEQAKEPDLQALLAKTIFKKLKMRDGKIVFAELNEPLDYICHKKLANDPVVRISDSWWVWRGSNARPSA